MLLLWGNIKENLACTILSKKPRKKGNSRPKEIYRDSDLFNDRMFWSIIHHSMQVTSMLIDGTDKGRCCDWKRQTNCQRANISLYWTNNCCSCLHFCFSFSETIEICFSHQLERLSVLLLNLNLSSSSLLKIKSISYILK